MLSCRIHLFSPCFGRFLIVGVGAINSSAVTGLIIVVCCRNGMFKDLCRLAALGLVILLGRGPSSPGGVGLVPLLSLGPLVGEKGLDLDPLFGKGLNPVLMFSGVGLGPAIPN